MKKKLIIAFAICVMFLSACGSLAGTNTPTSNAPAHSTHTAQSTCATLEESQASLYHESDAAHFQLIEAQARKNPRQVEEVETRLARLQQGIAWIQIQLKTC